MVASATTLRNTLSSEWALTGELSKVATGSGSSLMDQVVTFFDRAQVVGNEQVKSVVVEKINPEGQEVVTQYPNFNEVSDIYEITVAYRVIDVDEDVFSTIVGYLEDMGGEVVRILNTVYNPASTVGVYFRTVHNWTKEDIYAGNQPVLKRKLRFQLTTITSSNLSVYTGFGGVLVFDRSASAADDLPTSDYEFVEVENVDIQEGYSQIPVLTKDVTNGVGVPFQRRGLFGGIFTAKMYAAKNNIIGNTVDKLQNIYKTQNDADLYQQNANVTLLHSNNNSEATVSTLTTQSFMKITSIRKSASVQNLLAFDIVAVLRKPTVFTEST